MSPPFATGVSTLKPEGFVHRRRGSKATSPPRPRRFAAQPMANLAELRSLGVQLYFITNHSNTNDKLQRHHALSPAEYSETV